MFEPAAGLIGPTTPGMPTARWVASGRPGGVSTSPYSSMNLADYVGDDEGSVRENRQRLAARVDLTLADVAIMGAVHGSEVAIVTQGGFMPGVDALVTRSRGVGLLALAADCVPLVLADVDAGVVAAAHCGWRGLASGVVAATVATMRSAGASRIQAVVGPSICARCYPVPAERAALIGEQVSDPVRLASCLVHDGITFVDVGAGVLAQLAELGAQATVIPGCTAESSELFSYRRDQVTGRQGMMIVQ